MRLHQCGCFFYYSTSWYCFVFYFTKKKYCSLGLHNRHIPTISYLIHRGKSYWRQCFRLCSFVRLITCESKLFKKKNIEKLIFVLYKIYLLHECYITYHHVYKLLEYCYWRVWNAVIRNMGKVSGERFKIPLWNWHNPQKSFVHIRYSFLLQRIYFLLEYTIIRMRSPIQITSVKCNGKIWNIAEYRRQFSVSFTFFILAFFLFLLFLIKTKTRNLNGWIDLFKSVVNSCFHYHFVYF